MDSKNLLPGPIVLAKEAWELFRSKAATLYAVYIAGLLLSLGLLILGGLALFFGGAGVFAFLTAMHRFALFPVLLLVLLGVLLIAALFVAATWYQGALLVVLFSKKDKLSFGESFGTAWKIIGALVVTEIIWVLIIFGSYFVFLIPAIIFGVWFSLSRLVVVGEGKKGFAALLTSREYIRGRFWQYFWRVIAVYLPLIVLSIIIGFARNNSYTLTLRGLLNVASFLATPFYLTYSFVLYEHLKKLRGAVKPDEAKGTKIATIVVPVIGYLIFLLIVGSLITFLASIPKHAQEKHNTRPYQQQQAPTGTHRLPQRLPLNET
jgi:hypothetical protein